MKDLRKIIIEKGIKQMDVAKAIGVTACNMSLYLSGKRRIPSDKLPGLARVLGCTIDDLFEKE